MKILRKGDEQFDEGMYVIVERHDLVTVSTLLTKVMGHLYDNSPVQAAYRLQKVQDLIGDYRSHNNRLLPFDKEEE